MDFKVHFSGASFSQVYRDAAQPRRHTDWASVSRLGSVHLFTGIPATCKDLPLMRQSGLVIVGTSHYAPEQNCEGDEDAEKNDCFARITAAKFATHPYSLDLFFPNSLPLFIGERHTRF
jgi:hypothetical protein